MMMKAHVPMLAEPKERAWAFEGILEQLKECLQLFIFIFFIMREKYPVLFKPLLRERERERVWGREFMYNKE